MDNKRVLRELKIEITSKCPLTCLHCSSDSRPDRDESMAVPRIQALIEEFVGLGGTRVAVSGGEPLTHPSLRRILGILARLKLQVALYTTGLLDDSLQPPSLHEAMKMRNYIHEAIFSIHGGSAEEHDRVTRTPGSFSATLTAVRAFKTAGIPVSFHFVPMLINYNSLPRLMSLADEIGATGVSLLRFVPHGRGGPNHSDLELSKSEIVQLRDTIMELRRSSRVSLRVGSPFSILQRGNSAFCHAGIDTIVIMPDGMAYPCDGFKGYSIDDDHTNVCDDGIAAVWNGSKLFLLARQMAHEIPSDCQCAYTTSCRGGCPAQRLFSLGNGCIDRPDPSCLLSHCGAVSR